MSYSPFTTSGPTRLVADGTVLRRPDDSDAALVEVLMGDAADPARAAEVVADWRDHWADHGYGTWVVTSARDATPVGSVGLRAHGDELRLSVRSRTEAGASDLVARGLRVALADALERLPEEPIRMRAPGDDLSTRFVAESSGLVHVSEDDHVAKGVDWQVFEAPAVRLPRSVTERGREAMLDLWVRVNESGGAVGFAPGADRADVAEVLDGYLEPGRGSQAQPVVLTDPYGELLGMGFLVVPTNPLFAHTGNLERVMLTPDRQGVNLGRLLMAGMHRAARERGLELLTLDYRDGTGLGSFYAKLGYEEVGRFPGWVRLAPGDDRDRVFLARTLR